MNVYYQAPAAQPRSSNKSLGAGRWPHVAAVVLGLCIAGICAQRAAAGPAEGEDPAYTRVITQRADKIVGQLDIHDTAKATRVSDLIADQYRHVGAVHDALDAKIAEAKKSPGRDSAAAEAWVNVARDDATLKLFALHRQFVAALSAELSPDEVDKVKDGMTYGVLPLTYKAFQDMLPDLTQQQKTVILANLIEAREYAMDAGSSEEKHRWFGKYKGRINNYLASQGYDLKQAEKDWAARRKAAQQGK
jgi:hypothetical protein